MGSARRRAIMWVVDTMMILLAVRPIKVTVLFVLAGKETALLDLGIVVSCMRTVLLDMSTILCGMRLVVRQPVPVRFDRHSRPLPEAPSLTAKLLGLPPKLLSFLPLCLCAEMELACMQAERIGLRPQL